MGLWDEIYEQPEVIARTLRESAASVAAVAADPRVITSDYVVMAARGTSDNAARYAQYLWGLRNGRNVALAAPSLFGSYDSPPQLDGALVVAISQSGRSPDLIAVIEEARRQHRPTVVLTNDTSSPLASAADHVLGLHTGPELAVAATKTYTAQLTVLAQLSAAFDRDPADALARLPEAVAAALAADTDHEELAFLRDVDGLAVVGRGVNQATAFEVALKLQELAQILAHPYSAADFQHGPLALVEPGFPMIIVVAAGKLENDVIDLHRRVRALGAETLLLTNAGPAAGRTIAYPGVAEWLSPIVAIAAAHPAIYRLTQLRGLDPDGPRTITKVTETL